MSVIFIYMFKNVDGQKVEHFFVGHYKPEAQCAEPVSLTFHFVFRKLYTEPSIGNF